MSRDPYSTARKTRDAERVDHILGRKSGGRVADDSDTNIHIEVNATPKEDQTATDMPIPPPPLAPPPSPMMPPPGLGGGGLGGGGGPIGLKRGGAAKDCPPGMMKKAKGGATPDLGKKGKVDVGGAGGGTGRLEKTADARRGSD